MSGLDPTIKAVADAEEKNRRTLDWVKWANFVYEVRRFAPDARLLNQVHDEVRLDGVDCEDPHFQRHLKAFLTNMAFDCEEPDCVVSTVHEL